MRLHNDQTLCGESSLNNSGFLQNARTFLFHLFLDRFALDIFSAFNFQTHDVKPFLDALNFARFFSFLIFFDRIRD